ncbi:MAG: LptF/LptG family permease [Flavobacterium sp.]
MKILDKYLLKTFLITFTTVFVILFFIFILQTVWLFISELAGKDLDFILVLKFLLFSMPRIVPLVLPLSVLLASIMTFGSLAENYEFAAMKSSGISFQRTMRSITAFILVLSIISFFFANNVIPYAEYKFINFRRNIAQVKPAMAIAEGQFSKVGNYTIKVEKKLGEKGNLLRGVTIHKKLDNGEGSTTVIKAEKGELVSSESSNTLKLILTNGNYYEDIIPKRYEQRNKIPFAKGTFKKDVINIDLSKLNQTNMESVNLTNNTTMLNLSELRFTLDSLNKNYKKDLHSNMVNLYLRTGVGNNVYVAAYNKLIQETVVGNDFFKYLTENQKKEALKIATSNIENTSFSIDSTIIEMESKAKNINSHWIAIYDKFMIPFSCILMFFIGAPLGAIIRKGGLGLPIVFAIAIFITFHFINTFGQRVAQENGMPAFLGVWLSSIILTPLAILLTYRAINDIGEAISFDGITLFFQKIAEYTKLNVLFAKSEIDEHKVNYSTEKPTIKQIESIQEDLSSYSKLTKITLVLYFISLCCSAVLLKFNTQFVIILAAIIILIFLYFILKCQQIIENISLKTNTIIEPGIIISLLVAFPFYIIIYFFNKIALKKLLITNLS